MAYKPPLSSNNQKALQSIYNSLLLASTDTQQTFLNLMASDGQTRSWMQQFLDLAPQSQRTKLGECYYNNDFSEDNIKLVSSVYFLPNNDKLTVRQALQLPDPQRQALVQQIGHQYSQRIAAPTTSTNADTNALQRTVQQKDHIIAGLQDITMNVLSCLPPQQSYKAKLQLETQLNAWQNAQHPVLGVTCTGTQTSFCRTLLDKLTHAPFLLPQTAMQPQRQPVSNLTRQISSSTQLDSNSTQAAASSNSSAQPTQPKKDDGLALSLGDVFWQIADAQHLYPETAKKLVDDLFDRCNQDKHGDALTSNLRITSTNEEDLAKVKKTITDVVQRRPYFLKMLYDLSWGKEAYPNENGSIAFKPMASHEEGMITHLQIDAGVQNFMTQHAAIANGDKLYSPTELSIRIDPQFNSLLRSHQQDAKPLQLQLWEDTLVDSVAKAHGLLHNPQNRKKENLTDLLEFDPDNDQAVVKKYCDKKSFFLKPQQEALINARYAKMNGLNDGDSIERLWQLREKFNPNIQTQQLQDYHTWAKSEYAQGFEPWREALIKEAIGIVRNREKALAIQTVNEHSSAIALPGYQKYEYYEDGKGRYCRRNETPGGVQPKGSLSSDGVFVALKQNDGKSLYYLYEDMIKDIPPGELKIAFDNSRNHTKSYTPILQNGRFALYESSPQLDAGEARILKYADAQRPLELMTSQNNVLQKHMQLKAGKKIHAKLRYHPNATGNPLEPGMIELEVPLTQNDEIALPIVPSERSMTTQPHPHPAAHVLSSEDISYQPPSPASNTHRTSTGARQSSLDIFKNFLGSFSNRPRQEDSYNDSIISGVIRESPSSSTSATPCMSPVMPSRSLSRSNSIPPSPSMSAKNLSQTRKLYIPAGILSEQLRLSDRTLRECNEKEIVLMNNEGTPQMFLDPFYIDTKQRALPRFPESSSLSRKPSINRNRNTGSEPMQLC